MIIAPPPANSSPNELADWLELSAFASTSGVAVVRSVNGSLEIEEESEPEDLDAEGIVNDSRMEQAICAIEERIKVMEGSYPFEVAASGREVHLKTSPSPGGIVYLFCLVMSHGSKHGFFSGSSDLLPDMEQGRCVFQICATIAAAGFVVGPAFSFGWPRLGDEDFLEKLQYVYKQLGQCVVCDVIPPGAPPQVKDDGIDVIAWRYQPIRVGGTVYFLGQAASGANWTQKSLKNYVKTFHDTWFVKCPAQEATLGTIIPFVLETPADISEHRTQEEIEGSLRRDTTRHEIILFRHKVAFYVDAGLASATPRAYKVERIDDLHLVSSFVAEFRVKLQNSAAS